MKNVKLIMGLMLMLIMIQVSAQKKETTAEEKAKRQTKWMAKELALSAEQTAKVEAINSKYLTEIDQAENTIANKKERISKVKELRDKRMAELKTVLTPEQYTKLETLLKEKKEKVKARKSNN